VRVHGVEASPSKRTVKFNITHQLTGHVKIFMTTRRTGGLLKNINYLTNYDKK